MSEQTKRILGIDPGLNITGYGLIESEGKNTRLIEAGMIRGGSAQSATLGERIDKLFCGVNEIIESLHPDVLAVEQLYSHYKRPRTAILMGHARGAFLLAAARAKLPTADYAATQIKRMLTGNGRAPKNQMQQAIRIQLNLNQLPEPADVADALAIALCHHYFDLMPTELRQAE